MPAQIATTLRIILGYMRNQLIAQNVFPPSRVWLSMRMNPPFHEQADQYAIIVPLMQFADLPRGTGGGRGSKTITSRVNVYIRCRVALDSAYRDDIWLTSADYGLMKKAEEVVDALDFFIPTTPSGDILTIEPIRHVWTGEPRKDYSSPEWGDVATEWMVRFQEMLSHEDCQ